MGNEKHASVIKIAVGVGIIILTLFFFGFGKNESNTSVYVKAARAGGDYLLRQLQDDGSFVYQYNPVTEKTSDSYSIIRHAGTTYSLLELYETTGEQKYLRGAERALLYLRNRTGPCPENPTARCVYEGNKITLGANALTLLALTKHIEATGSRLYVTEAKGLAEFIVSTKSPVGEFLIHSMNAATGAVYDVTSIYYPGEAVFALTRLYAIDKKEKWISAAHQGAHFLIETRDPELSSEELGNNHWLMYAINELHKNRRDTIYVADMKDLVDAIVSTQHKEKMGAESDWNGGYYDPPRSTPTAIRNEGLVAAYNLFTRIGETKYAEKAFQSLTHGIAFTLRTQFTGEKITALQANPKGVGGFHRSLNNYNIRIDYVQHNISALLGFSHLLRE